MPRDHFVAETYLKQFVGADGMLRAYRKSDGLGFPCAPRAICREWDGDLVRDFLKDERLIGSFRAIFEPAWNSAIASLVGGTDDPSTKLAIAGYWANLMVCTPAWTRVSIKTREHDAMRTLRAHDALTTQAGNPDPKLKTMLAEFDTGNYRVEAERDAIRAMNATHLMGHAWQLYNADWILIKNDSDTDFITSDNPVAFDDPGPWRGGENGLPRYLDLTPRLGLYGLMNPRLIESDPDFAQAPKGSIRRGSIPQYGVDRVNRAVARCAEDLVISSKECDAVQALAHECARFHVDVEFINLRLRPDEFIFGDRTRVWERQPRGVLETAAL